jgi:hypothetical protein
LDYQFLTSQVEKFEARIAERMQPHQERIELCRAFRAWTESWHGI